MLRCLRCRKISRRDDLQRNGGVCPECYAIRMRELEVHGGVMNPYTEAVRLRDRIKALEDRLVLMDRTGVNVIHTPLGFQFSRELTLKELRVLREDLAQIPIGERRAA